MFSVHPLFDKPKRNVLPLVLALAGSVGFHAALPMVDRVKMPQAESRSVIDFIPMETAPDPLAEAEDPVAQEPDTPPEPASEPDAPPEAVNEPAKEPEPPHDESIPDETLPDETEGQAREPEAPPAEPEAPPTPASDEPEQQPDDPVAKNPRAHAEPEVPDEDVRAGRSRASMSDRLARNEARLAAIKKARADAWRDKRKKARDARAKARRDKLAAARKSKVKSRPPPAALKKGGTPDAVWVCGARDRGFRTEVLAERSVSDWVTLVPTVLLAFPTSPNMLSYLDDVRHVRKRKRTHQKRVGKSEFILPRGPIEVELDSPRDALAHIGRPDVRCLVGVTYTKTELFPMELLRVPLSIKEKDRPTKRALVDIRFYRDGTFDVVPASEVENGDVGFKTGRLKNAGLIQSTIDSHLYAAKTLTDVGKIIGVDVGGMVRDKRKRTAKAKSQHDKVQAQLEKLKQDAEAARKKKRNEGRGRKAPSQATPPGGAKPPPPTTTEPKTNKQQAPPPATRRRGR